MELTNNRINTVKVQNNNNHPTEISSLRATFVVAPVEKPIGNVAFICKSLYVDVLIKKLVIAPDRVSGNSDTYNVHDINDHENINQHSEYFQTKFKLKYDQDNKVIVLYWLSKLHKNPSKVRFIMASILIEVSD